ncbi:MAG: DNA methyltransferase [Bryobacteraceae bacterium]|jgi:site-specific DNA-methyltransferase (adenine-specific)
MPRVGGFPPALARYLIAAHSKPGDVVLDPFCGKGTVLFEASRMGRRAVGGDIAPDAVVASRAKCAKVSLATVANYIQKLNPRVYTSTASVPSEVRVFYSRKTLLQILSLRDQLLQDMRSEGADKEVATFVCGVLLGILHGHSRVSLSVPSNQCFAMAPNYVRRYVSEHGLEPPQRDVKQCLLIKAMAMLPGPRWRSHAEVYEASAEDCASYAGSYPDVALALTSPPYLNRQTYSKDAWLRLWFLGEDHREVAKRSLESGSVRIFVQSMTRVIRSIGQCVRSGGTIVIVGGRANVHVGSTKTPVRIVDLCLHAIHMLREAGAKLTPLQIISDRAIMKRGSYFAVYAGKHRDENGNKLERYGEEEILIVRKR